MWENAFCQGVFFGNPTVRSVGYNGNHYIDLPVEIKQELINEMDCELTVVLRSGLPVRLPSTLGRNMRRLTMRFTIVIGRATCKTTADFLAQIGPRSPQTLQILKKAYEQHQPNFAPRSPIVLQLDYVVTREDLRKHGNTLYFFGPDCIVSTESSLEKLIHPYSQEGMLHRTDLAIVPPAVREGGAVFAVEIVDNTSVFGDRYLNIAQQIYPVRAKKDPTRECGVYITRTDPTEGELGSAEIKVEHHPFRGPDRQEVDFSRFNLFRTYTEAVVLGDVAAARKESLLQMELDLQTGKKELEELKQENERRRTEFEESKLAHDREVTKLNDVIADKERRYREMEIERDRIRDERELERLRKKDDYEEKSLERKDDYEERSQRRKDSSEWVKIVPGIVIGLIGLGTAILSLRKK